MRNVLDGFGQVLQPVTLAVSSGEIAHFFEETLSDTVITLESGTFTNTEWSTLSYYFTDSQVRKFSVGPAAHSNLATALGAFGTSVRYDDVTGVIDQSLLPRGNLEVSSLSIPTPIFLRHSSTTYPSGYSYRRTTLTSITDIGISVIRTESDLFIWLTRFSDGSIIHNAIVQLFQAPYRRWGITEPGSTSSLLHSLTTDRNGMAQLSMNEFVTGNYYQIIVTDPKVEVGLNMLLHACIHSSIFAQTQNRRKKK